MTVTEVNLTPHYLAAQTIETGNALTAAQTDVATHKVNVKQARDALRAREVELTLQGIEGKNAETRKAYLLSPETHKRCPLHPSYGAGEDLNTTE